MGIKLVLECDYCQEMVEAECEPSIYELAEMLTDLEESNGFFVDVNDDVTCPNCRGKRSGPI